MECLASGAAPGFSGAVDFFGDFAADSAASLTACFSGGVDLRGNLAGGLSAAETAGWLNFLGGLARGSPAGSSVGS